MTKWFENKFDNDPGRVVKRRISVRRPGFLSTYTGMIIVINIIAFIGALILINFIGNDKAISLVALMPSAVLSGKTLWTFVTSMFMHAGFAHLFVNMVSLMFIGSFVEKLIGKKRFLWLYLAGGLFAGIFFVALAGLFGNTVLGAKIVGSPMTYAVGASGAIFALGGLLAVLTPRLPVLVFFIIPMPMWMAMGFLMFGIWALSLGFGLPIGNMAHFGGLIIGLGYGVYLKKKYPGRTKMISKYFTR